MLGVIYNILVLQYLLWIDTGWILNDFNKVLDGKTHNQKGGDLTAI